MARKKKTDDTVSKTLKKKRKYKKRTTKIVDPVVEIVVKPEPEPEPPKPDWPELGTEEYIAITYKTINGSLQIGGHLVTHDSPLITRDPYGLPATYEMLKSIKSVDVQIIKDPLKFVRKIYNKEVKEVKQIKKKVVSKDGVMWTGDTLYKTTGYGQFKKDVPQFGLSPEAVDELTSSRGRFVRVKKGQG